MSTLSNRRALAAQSPKTDGIAPSVPLVKADTALLSLRSSGHDFCSALGEVVDNSLEAGANLVKIRTFTAKKKVGSGSRSYEVIERLAVGDDGEGMPKDVLHKALQLGFSSRYNSRVGMGRFGVGAKLGGISQAKRIEIFSRQSSDSPWLFTFVDLEEIEKGKDYIPEPAPADLPSDCSDLVGVDRGTLVVWSKTDRLQERETGGARQAGKLQSDLVAYISRTFRTFLDGGKVLWVNDICVKPHDPLFLMTTTRFHEIPEKTSAKLADFPTNAKFPRACGEKISFDPKAGLLTWRGSLSKEHQNLLLGFAETDDFRRAVEAMLGDRSSDETVANYIASFRDAVAQLHDHSNPDPVAKVLHKKSFEFDVPSRPGQTSPVEVTVTLLPEKFWAREKPTDRPGGSRAAKERRIDENEGVSILRAGREIFHGYLRDVQPPVIELDRFIGVEIRFRPDLDECFQVRNVKKGAEPLNGLRDKLQAEVHSTVKTARNQIESWYAELKAKQETGSRIHQVAEQVVDSAKEVSPQPRAGQDVSEDEKRRKIEDAAEELTRDKPHERKEAAEAIKSRPLTFVPKAWPGSDFIQVEHLGTTGGIVQLNTQHPFYTEVYSKLVEAMEPSAEVDVINLARLVQVGLDLLILSYAQAEAVEKEASAKYANLRTYWGLHLKNNIQHWIKPQA